MALPFVVSRVQLFDFSGIGKLQSSELPFLMEAILGRPAPDIYVRKSHIKFQKFVAMVLEQRGDWKPV